MLIFDAIPTVVPAITLPFKIYEIKTSDWAYGFDKAIVHKFTSDSAYTSDVLKELDHRVRDEAVSVDTLVSLQALVEVLELGTGYDFIPEFYKTSVDTGLAEDIAKLIIPVSDLATSYETVVAFGVTVYTVDTSEGFEIRLSPVPVEAYDLSSGYDILIEFARIVEDLGTGFERMWFTVFASEVAEGFDIVTSLLNPISKIDSAIGSEVRLSPVPIITSDSSEGVGTISGWYRPIEDVGQGVDFGMLGYLVKDVSVGTEKIVGLYREIFDKSTGSEVRLSPVPLREFDTGVGKDIGLLVYREYLSSDVCRGLERIVFKLTSYRDEAVGYDIGYMSVFGLDVARTVESVIFRTFTKFDFAETFEKRLSPIPLHRSDLSEAFDREMLDKAVDVFDSGVGTEFKEIRIPVPPKYQGISISFSISLVEVSSIEQSLYSTIKSKSSLAVTATSKVSNVSPTQLVKSNYSLYNIFRRGFSTTFTPTIILNYSVKPTDTEYVNALVLKPFINLVCERYVRANVVAIHLCRIRIPIDIELFRFRSLRFFSYLYQELYCTFGKVLHLECYVVKQTLRNILTLEKLISPIYEIPKQYVNITNSVQTFKPLTIISSEQLYNSVNLSSYLEYSNHLILRGIKVSELNLSWGFHTALCNNIIYVPKSTVGVEESIITCPKDYSYVVFPITVQLTEVFERGFMYGIEKAGLAVTLREEFYRGLLSVYYRYLESYKHLLKFMAFLPNIRYVKYGDPVLPDDINIFYNAFNLFVRFAETLADECFKDDKDVWDALNYLKERLSTFRKVKLFDFVLAWHRNQVVDLIMRARNFLETVWKKLHES